MICHKRRYKRAFSIKNFDIELVDVELLVLGIFFWVCDRLLHQSKLYLLVSDAVIVMQNDRQG